MPSGAGRIRNSGGGSIDPRQLTPTTVLWALGQNSGGPFRFDAGVRSARRTDFALAPIRDTLADATSTFAIAFGSAKHGPVEA
jgi:hypothetical protein